MKIIRWLLLVFVLFACNPDLNDIEAERKRTGIPIDPVLLQQTWQVDFFREFGVDRSGQFEEGILSIQASGRLYLDIGQNRFFGDWVLADNNQVLIIRMRQAGKPQEDLQNEWVVTELGPASLKIIEQDLDDDGEFHFSLVQQPEWDWSLLYTHWEVSAFESAGANLTAKYQQQVYSFKPNGEVNITLLNDKILPAVYALNQKENQLTITSGNALPATEILAQWQVENLTADQLKLSNNNNHVTFRRYFGTVNPDPVVFDASRLKNTWNIFYFQYEDQDITSLVGNARIAIQDQQLFKVKTTNGLLYSGNWNFDVFTDQLNLNIDLSDPYLDELDDDWQVVYLQNDTLKLVEKGDDDTRIHLVRSSGPLTSYPDYWINAWVIKSAGSDDDDDGSDDDDDGSNWQSLEGAEITFSANDVATLLINGNTWSGSWSLSADLLQLQWNDTTYSLLLNNTWQVLSLSAEQIQLVNPDGIEIILEK